MKHALVAVGAVLLIMLLPLMLMFGASQATTTAPAPTVTITQTVTVPPIPVRTDNSGPGSVNSGRQPPHLPTILPTVRVTIRVGVPGPTKTVTAHAAPQRVTRTQTVRVPGPTVFVPGPTRTIAPPPVTRTVETPGPTVTVGGSPNSTPNSSQSPPSETGGRQDTNEGGTIIPGGPIDFGDDTASPAEVGIGILSVLAAVALILAALYGGYVLGYKDKEGKDTDFMRTLLDTAKRRH